MVLITKADLIAKQTGLPISRVIPEALQAVQRLLPPVFGQRVTTLICPVQIGRINTEDYDRHEVTPRWLEKPLIFSLCSYLTEQITADQELFGQIARRDAEAAAHLGRLRSSFLCSSRPGKAENRPFANARQTMTSDLSANEDEAERLAAELDDVLVVRNGKPQF